MSRKTFELSVGDKEYKVDIEEFDGKRARVKVDGKSFEVGVKEGEKQVPRPVPAPPTPAAPKAPVKTSPPEPPPLPSRSAPSP